MNKQRNRFIIIVLCIAAAIAFLIPAFGQKSKATAETKDKVSDPLVLLQKAYPRMMVNSVKESEIPGLYEIQAGNNIMYFYPPKSYLLFGEIMTKDGKSLTAQKRDLIFAEKMKNINLKSALKVGTGKIEVVEITNPNCSYCRKAAAYFAKPEVKERVTRYTFFMPMDQGSLKKVQYVMSAQDKEKAYEKVMLGKVDETELVVTKEGTRLVEMQKSVGQGLGIIGTPTFRVNGVLIIGADMGKLEKAIGVPSQIPLS